MQRIKKNFWGVLVLIAAVSVILAYVATEDSVLAQLTDGKQKGKAPVTLQAELVQDKVMKGSDGTVAVSLTLTGAAVERPDLQPIRHADLVVVLDCSGSMQGRKIDDARQAVLHLIDRMSVKDRLSLVTYSNGVNTVFPLTFMDEAHRRRIKAAVGQVYSGGGTNLGGGLQRGMDTLMHTPSEQRQRKVILISDGLANHGITDPAALGRMAGGAAAHDFSVSTVGVGYDFNEMMMTTIADHGAGSYYFLENPNAFARVFEKEFESARRVAASALQIRVPLQDGLQLIHAGGYPIELKAGEALVRPGDMLSGQTRKLFLTFHVPTDEIGTIQLGAIDVQYWHNGVLRTVAGRRELTLACVQDEKAVLSSIDQAAWGEQVVKEAYSQLRKEVAAAIRSGEKEAALNQIGVYEARNREINRSVGSATVAENLNRDVQTLRQSVEDTFAGSPAAVEQKKKQHSKALHYESYKIRRDKQ
jgi:Ca-activated chloride channel family protein